jgi:methyl-accepting chemotaxis protein
MKDMKLSVKLVGGFTIVAAIVLVVGFVGLNGTSKLASAMADITDNQLPSVLSLEIVNEAQTAVDSAENSLLATNLDTAARKGAFDRFDAAQKRAVEAMKIYEPLPRAAEEDAAWTKFKTAWDDWWKSHLEFVRLEQEYEAALAANTDAGSSKVPARGTGASSDLSRAYAAMSNQALVVEAVTFAAAETPLNQVIEINKKSADAASVDSKVAVRQVSTIALVGMVVGFAVALLLGIVLSTGVLNQLGTEPSIMMEIARRVSEGDLTIDFETKKGKKAKGAYASLQEMTIKLREMVSNVQSNADQLASSTEQISSSSQQQAEGAQSQASTLEETSASIEELTASVDQVAEHAQSQAAAVEQGTVSMSQVQKSIEAVSSNLNEIAGLARKSAENAIDGTKAVQQVVAGINEIAQSSQKISGIVTVISDIADQTNLLALNASIEAARAGEHGRGFAVVADEVSKLADRSASSTKEIENLIKESVKNVTEGVSMAHGSQNAMEQIRDASQRVKDMIGGLSESMSQQVAAVHQLAEALSNVSEMSQSISAATEEQTTNAKQVSVAVENVNEITQAAASASEQTSAATEQLASMAQDLQRLMAQFKLTGDGADKKSTPASESRPDSGNGNGNGKAHTVKIGALAKV